MKRTILTDRVVALEARSKVGSLIDTPDQGRQRQHGSKSGRMAGTEMVTAEAPA